MRIAIPAPPHRTAYSAVLALCIALVLLAALPLHATGQAAATKHKAHGKTPAPVPAVVTQPAPPPQPVAPPPPDWPANARPAEAHVVWNSDGLSIQAANSSLIQILKEVATATGTKVDGLSTDQRIFGAYGPGRARDVLAKLLEGSGYNVLMIGDQGQGTPRQILLTAKPTGNAPKAFNNQTAANDDSADDDPPPEQPEPPVQPPNVRNGFAPGAPPRTPQQIMQEMQQRQEQMQPQPPQ